MISIIQIFINITPLTTNSMRSHQRRNYCYKYKKDPFQAKSIAPNLYNHPIRSKTSQILPLLVSLKIKLSFFYVTIEASASSHQALLNIAFILQVFLPSYFFASCYKKGYKNRTKCTSGHVHASCKTWSVFLCIILLRGMCLFSSFG